MVAKPGRLVDKETRLLGLDCHIREHEPNPLEVNNGAIELFTLAGIGRGNI